MTHWNRERITVSTILILTFLACFLTSCATFSQDAYRTLSVSQQAYDVTLSAMGDLYKEGKLTEAQKNQAIIIGRAYKLAHNEAVLALAEFELKGGSASKDAYIAAAAKAATSLSALIAYCRPFIEKGGK